MIIYEHIFLNNNLEINEIEVKRKQKIDIGNFKGTLQKSLRINEYDVVKSTKMFGFIMYSENENRNKFLREIKQLQEEKINKIIEEYQKSLSEEKDALEKISSLI